MIQLYVLKCGYIAYTVGNNESQTCCGYIGYTVGNNESQTCCGYTGSTNILVHELLVLCPD